MRVDRVVDSESLAVALDGVKKSDDRSLLNWDKSSKMTKKQSPNLLGFNETEYIAKGHKDRDAYKLNAFNQAESDKLKSDRAIPDTRNYR